MSIYTNTGLVTHVKKALELKTKYMWAGTLNPITDAYITQKVKQCEDAGVPASRSGYTDARIKELRKIAGKGFYGVDCICLVKSYLWDGIGSPDYSSSTDVNANIMYNLAKEKGKISTMPEVPGLIVYSKTHPHVGVYIGGGETIESTLGVRGDGVVKRQLDSFWEYWLKCPFIEYVSGNSEKVSTAMLGQLSRVTFAYKAKVRAKPRADAALLGEYKPGQTATIVIGSGAKDPVSGYEYVRIAGDTERWVVKSSLRK